ncbi:SusD/RagB family nutrient-binding outer membrane lipoprotein [uncultured Bacteroides sp.]|uniref:SusD/RagB family nutrient-binding outer membrane lipoprotein n=1 Tax=uncultured Bacteroides sp. TaxID=162156 RepID=UPI00344C8221
MKRNSIYGFVSACSVAALLASCTGAFEDMNTDPNGVTDEELLQDNNYIGAHFPSMEKSIYYNKDGWGWDFQTIQNLTSDIWSGYMATPSLFLGGMDTQTYVTPSDWTDTFWNYTYDAIMVNQLKVKEKCEEMGMETYAHFNAINTLLRVFAMSRVVDEYGPIIYSKYGESKTGGTYDSAEDAYKLFFSELTEASNVLYEYSQKEEVASFANFDMAYGGDLSKWLKLCNTLRLRLALRVVKYDAGWAKQEGEAAINAPMGLLQSGEGFIISGFEWKHPLYTCSIEYNDMFISANTKSILGGYNDPRLELFGMAKKVSLAGGQSANEILGVRSGISDLDKLADKYKAVIANINVGPNTPGVVMSSAEPYFLLAEAALRGWNGWDRSVAKSYYEDGVKASFNEWGVNVGDYLSSHAVPTDFVDPLTVVSTSDEDTKALAEQNNIAAVSTTTPCWDDASSDEERLEKIITQKWIAGFPEGKNAWAEWRRTGYPKLFPIRQNNSGGVIPTELGVRRIPFVQEEVANNPEGYAKAVELLGGPDNGATRIFWDVDAPNF